MPSWAGLAKSWKSFGEDGDVQVAGGLAPAKAGLFVGGLVLFGPEDPGGKEAVEQRLDERRAEEVVAALAFKGHAQRFLERLRVVARAGSSPPSSTRARASRA